METAELKYTIIKNRQQYEQYCRQLEYLVNQTDSTNLQDEIDLVTLLIEKYDEENNTFNESDPITLLRSFMNEQNLKQQDLVSILGISKGYVSDILNYKKGLSKEVIRKLGQTERVQHSLGIRAIINTDPQTIPAQILHAQI